MLQVYRIINELMTSNCYVVWDDVTLHCLVIDPASEQSLCEIKFIETNMLHIDYIILTHEHTDHTWGVNSLKERYPDAKILCSEACNKYAPKASRAYFLFYYDDEYYRYAINPADVIVKKQKEALDWNNYQILFIMTPGHSYGSMCIGIDNLLFTGDTIMPFKPYFNGRDSNEEDWIESVEFIKTHYPNNTIIYPGHGNLLTLRDWMELNFDNDG